MPKARAFGAYTSNQVEGYDAYMRYLSLYRSVKFLHWRDRVIKIQPRCPAIFMDYGCRCTVSEGSQTLLEVTTSVNAAEGNMADGTNLRYICPLMSPTSPRGTIAYGDQELIWWRLSASKFGMGFSEDRLLVSAEVPWQDSLADRKIFMLYRIHEQMEDHGLLLALMLVPTLIHRHPHVTTRQ